MTPEQIVSDAAQLSIPERKRLIILIVDAFLEAPIDGSSRRKRSVLEFEGVGAHTREQRIPSDAQEYINQLRSE